MEHGTDQPPSQGDYRRDDTPPLHGPFDSVAPTEKQHALIVRARQAYDLLRLDIKASTKTGRYQSLAITALEESAMWLNKAITHDG